MYVSKRIDIVRVLASILGVYGSQRKTNSMDHIVHESRWPNLPIWRRHPTHNALVKLFAGRRRLVLVSEHRMVSGGGMAVLAGGQEVRRRNVTRPDPPWV